MDKKIINSFDKTNLYMMKNTLVEPLGVVVIVHGLAEYCERYDYLTDKLNRAGFSVYRFDLRGHGKSGNISGWVDDYNYYIDDLDIIVSKAKEENPDLPLFVLGHSMGGFISGVYALRNPKKINGVILSGAVLEKPKDGKGIRGVFIRIMAKIYPEFKMKNNLGKLVSRDPKVVEEYNNDKLVLKSITIKLYYEFLIRGVSWLERNKDQFTVSTLLLHGKDDKIINYNSIISFEERILSKDKKIIIYEKLYHEIFNEKEKDEVIKDVIDWLNKSV